MVNKMQRGGKYQEMDEMDVVKQYYSLDDHYKLSNALLIKKAETRESIKNELNPDIQGASETEREQYLERSRANLYKYMKKLDLLRKSAKANDNANRDIIYLEMFIIDVWHHLPPGPGPPPAPPLPGK